MDKAISMMESSETRDVISMHAWHSGLKSGAIAATIVGTGVVTANKFSKAFRTRLGVSGKVALVVSSFLATFVVESEKRVLEGARNPEKYLKMMDPNYIDQAANKHDEKLRWYHRTANFVYDHPYRTLATAGVPLVGGIFAYQSTNHAIQRSQQIMHTRIYGQGAVVVLLLSSMAFHDYMSKRGRFGEEEDHELNA